jgi:hypothetical protein
MASRNFSRKQSLEKEIKEIYARVNIGASGAPTLQDGLGVASITRDSAGVYILTLEDKYTRLMHIDVKQLAAAAEDLTFQLEAQAVSTTKTITFRCLAAAVETDPSSGSVLYVKMDLKNTSVAP